MPVTLPPSKTQRAAAAILIGLACGLLAWSIARRTPPNAYQDFAMVWFAARDLLAGKNPYHSVVSLTGAPLFFFPLTTPLIVTPFLLLPLKVAGAVFVWLATTALAYVVTAKAWWPLLMFVSGSMVVAVVTTNFAIVLPLGFFVPSLGWIGGFKPNIGIAMLAYRPSWKNCLIMILLAVASLLVKPDWPRDWLTTAMASPFHFAPWRTAGGFILILAAVRWRLPEARMLLMMALLPSSPIAYEALPLFTIPRTKREMLLLAISTNIIFVLIVPHSFQGDRETYLAIAQPAMVWLAYVPALLMVLSRPNTGPAPAWVERIVARAPSWIAGKGSERPTVFSR